MAKHALLSASSSARWLACPPSARLAEHEPDAVSDYAAAGTEAHCLGEYKLRKLLGHKVRDPTRRLKFYDGEMEDCAEAYALHVFSLVSQLREKCQDTVALVEQQVDFSEFVPEGFGTADALVVADGGLWVVDYKHGQGVAVSADHNSQLMLYALGAVRMFGALYDIDQVTLVIFQPRLANVSEFTLAKDELLSWAETVLAPRAKLAYEGGGEFSAGEHCQFCAVKATCRKRAEYNLELARYDFAMPPTLADAEVEAVLARADELIAWAGDVKEYALGQAVRGKVWAGWKLVEGRSNRRYADEAAVAAAVQAAGYEPYERRLLGITAMTSLLGRKRFAELLGELVVKPQGRPVLVPESDKRPIFNAAADDFADNSDD